MGRLAGLGRDLGVVVQDCETADYKNLEADVAIVAMTDRVAQNLVAYKRLMNAGLNVICHGSESYYPQISDPDIADQIDRIAAFITDVGNSHSGPRLSARRLLQYRPVCTREGSNLLS